MFAKRIAAVVLMAASTLSAVAVAAPSGAHSNCILAQHRVTQVQPLHVSERYGRGTVERLAGARVFVQAEPGLTAEWLQLSLQRHLAGMNGAMANCALDAKDVQVKVVSAGPGFSVQITGKSAAQGQEILRRAQLLVR
ncbi:MAG TPA: hypothetical protein VHM25_09015 [Polyangiaceae bacterium]|jgi:hypothetical protein|nr:hypothetical protein [Polyangiaceae bacterium]